MTPGETFRKLGDLLMMNKMMPGEVFRKLGDLLRESEAAIIKKDKCYRDRELDGIASSGLCGGLVGGTRATEYCQEQCVTCKYLFMNNKENTDESK